MDSHLKGPLQTEQPSQERKEQQRMLGREAQKKSWIKRLLRIGRQSKGSPRAGNQR